MSSEPVPQPTRLRQIVSAIVIALVVVAAWWVIEIRTALPPPPNVELPPP